MKSGLNNLKFLNLALRIKKMFRSIFGKFIIFFAIILLMSVGALAFFTWKANIALNKISIADEPLNQKFYLPQVSTQVDTQTEFLPKLFKYKEPLKDPNRINILLLGIRGENDPYGGLLTDTIVLASFQISDQQLALISIPRDIYIQLPFRNNWSKVNEAYAEGFKIGGERGGIELARHTIQRITAVAVDHVIRVDFDAFKKAVDLVGGIDIYLEKPFEEKEQFKGAGTFYLPAGLNHLNSEQALYFVRSRYSTNDFDRAKRTQQVLLALKNKILQDKSLYSLAKINEILNILGDHVRTDMSVAQIKEYFSLYNHLDFSKVITKVFTDAPDGELISKILNGVYVLLPKDGTFEKIQEEVKNIFNKK